MTDTQLLPPPTPIDSTPQVAPPPVAPQQAPRERRRRWPWVLLGVGVTLLVLVALAVIGLLAAPSTLVDDDLNDGSGPFAHESDELVTLDFVDGGYAMILEPVPGNLQEARSFWEPSVRAVRVAASFEVRDTGSQEYVVGVSCKAAGAMYHFVVDPTGYASLALETDSLELLVEEEITPPATTGRLELTCRGGGDSPTELVGLLDGVEVISYSHVDGYESFNAMGLVAWSEDGLDVLWDDPFAERL